jgi:uncharacterized protein YbjT (DUF2867 family)/phosphoserine phosphatase
VAGTAVSLAIASVPEGLPFVATAGQLAGARRLAAGGAVVRNPRTVEALGRVDIVCVDKTGTLTEGRVALTALSDGQTTTPLEQLDGRGRSLLAAALRASERPEVGTSLEQLDDTDEALHRAAAAQGISITDGAPGWKLVGELPFEASRGLHAVLGRSGGQHRLAVKGGPEVILEASTSWCPEGDSVPIDDAARQLLLDHVDALAARGHRLLAVAEREASSRPDVEENRLERLCLLGFLVLSDPVRRTAAQAIRGIAEAGVRTIMLTGDHPETAISIASELDLHGDGSVVTGADLETLDDQELTRALEGAAVVARVTPAHKLRIVQVLQANGHAVAMTGDGGNDAPAIRLADVGVAFGHRASPAARDAADIVIADDRIETLIDAIAEGRALWGSIREALAVLVGGNLGEIAFTSIASAFSPSSPLNARQFLLVNLFTDLAPAVAIAVRPPADVSTETLLREGPEASLGEALRRDVAIRGTATALGATAAWGAARLTGTARRASTVGLVALVGTQLGQTVAAGGWKRPSTLLTAAGSAAGLAAVIQTPGLSGFFGSRPLGPVGWTQAATAATVATAGSQIASRVAMRADRREATAVAEPRGKLVPLNGRHAHGRSDPDVGRAEDGTLDVLVTGATGFVGGQLVPRLLAEGHRVRVLVRDRARLTASWQHEVEVIDGRVEDPQAVLRAADGCAAAYYLVHGLDGSVKDLVERERAAAASFRDGVELAGVRRIVYLGGLVDESALRTTSEHLYARQQVGEELRAGEVPVTELRAGIVIGAGSASFELLLAAARTPIALRAPWSSSLTQPIAADDLTELLVTVLDDPRAAWQVLDVGGPDVMTYEELVAEVRSRSGRAPAPTVPLPYLPPEATAAAAAAIAGVDPALTLALLQSVRVDAVVRDDHARTLYPDSARTGVGPAIDAALSGEVRVA